MEKDGLLEVKDDGIYLTYIGRDFTQNIMNILINMIHQINRIKIDSN